MHRSIVQSALAGLLALGAVSATTATSSVGSPVGCGDKITVDTTLESDLVDCPSNGIVIGADGITLDLNGHLIDGDGTAFAACKRRTEVCDVGVVNDGHDGVTVRNGSVREFDTGVGVVQARHNRVLGVSSSANRYFGFILGEAQRTVIRDGSGNDNPEPDGDGLGVFGSRHIQILDNSFRRNSLGVHVEDSSDVSIEGNVISRNSGPGILMEADGNEIRRNRCVRNGACMIIAPGSRNVIARNRIKGDGDGIALEKGRGNRVIGNVIAGVKKSGIYLALDEPPIGGARNVVRGNRVSDAGGDAFKVRKRDRHSVVRDNVAIGSADDGFDVRSRSATLAGNRAMRNGDLGIEAVGGVTDGGGNIARGNGDPRGCTHIACR